MADGVRAIQQEVGNALISHKCKTSADVNWFFPPFFFAKNGPDLDVARDVQDFNTGIQAIQCFRDGKIYGFGVP